MTRKLYDEDAYLREFDAEVISCTQNGKKYEVILDKTAFFPEGGGQPGDRGRIAGAEVTDTVEKDGEVIHICSKAVSGSVHCTLDWDFRFLNMQQHSGEHIFSGFTHSLTGLDNVGFHMSNGDVTIDFNGPVTDEQLEKIELDTNKAIYENRKINIILPSREELCNYNYRSKKEIQGQVRLVEIEGVDLCACCGTHVALTGEVGLVKIISSESHRQGIRIVLRIGGNAFEDYIKKNRNVLAISASLCAKADEVADYVERLKAKLNDTRAELSAVRKKLFEAITENVDETFPAAFYDSGSADDARALADILADKVKIAYAFSGNDKDGYKYAIISHSEDVREAGKALNAALSGRGGGKPDCVMGSVMTTKEEIIKYFA